MAEVPTRVNWAVKQLDPAPDDTILEIGCGDGSALSRIVLRLEQGHVVGVDRSGVAIKQAERKNRDAIKSGKVRLIQSELADLKLTEKFSKVFALNVNLFWHRPKKDLEVIRELLSPNGQLVLMFEPPSADHLGEISTLTRRNLEANAFTVTFESRAKLPASAGLLIRAVANPD